MSESSYKVYASEEYVDDAIANAAVTDDHINELIDAKAELPAGSAAHQMLVTDADGSTKWEDKLCYEVAPTVVIKNWGGTTATVFDESFYKSSELTPTYDELIGATLTINGTEYIITADMVNKNANWLVVRDPRFYTQVPDIASIAVVYNTNLTSASIVIDGVGYRAEFTSPASGLYMSESGANQLSYGGVLSRLDEKYIPDTIARTSDIPAAVTDDHINTLIDSKLEAAHPTELITIPASAWTGTEAPYLAMNQACSIATMTNKLIVSLSPTLASDGDGLNEMLSADTYDAIAKSKLMAVIQADGAITLAAYGKKPEIDIPVIVTEVG